MEQQQWLEVLLWAVWFLPLLKEWASFSLAWQQTSSDPWVLPWKTLHSWTLLHLPSDSSSSPIINSPRHKFFFHPRRRSPAFLHCLRVYFKLRRNVDWCLPNCFPTQPPMDQRGQLCLNLLFTGRSAIGCSRWEEKVGCRSCTIANDRIITIKRTMNAENICRMRRLINRIGPRFFSQYNWRSFFLKKDSL